MSSGKDEALAIARGAPDPYQNDVARKAAMFDLADPRQQEIAERREKVQRLAVLGKTNRQMAATLGVSAITIAGDLEHIRAANKLRFKGTTPREIAAALEAGHDYVISRAVDMAERAKTDGDLPEPADLGDVEQQTAYFQARAKAEDREREALKLVTTGLKNKLEALVKCGIAGDEPEKTEDDRRREEASKKVGEQAKDILLSALYAKLGGDAPLTRVTLHPPTLEQDNATEAAEPTPAVPE